MRSKVCKKGALRLIIIRLVRSENGKKGVFPKIVLARCVPGQPTSIKSAAPKVVVQRHFI